MKQIKLMLGDNIQSLKKLPENSIDSIVTDPPYGLSFMNKKWDYDVPSTDFWKEVYRVLKPGGHVLSFGGTRTYHRMVVNMEDAGFEIRDQIMWIYGSGFPKSLNIGRAYDKKQGNEREVIGEVKQPRMNNDYGKGNHNEREIKELDITKGSSQYEGWGSAIKPANEPICLARKPLSEKTIVDNVIKWGTGGINIDGCRIDYKDDNDKNKATPGGVISYTSESWGQQQGLEKEQQEHREANEGGRFPANILFDEIAAEMLDEQSGITKSSTYDNSKGDTNGFHTSLGRENKKVRSDIGGHNDKGGASRFFYIAKSNQDLIDYLTKLITPENGTILIYRIN